jgi:CubicO group peptidase (beta-lactamase class C family)
MLPGLTRIDDAPYPGAYRRPFPFLSGGGGLASSLPDMVALIRALLPGGATLLKPETIAMMMTNQLPEGVWIKFQGVGVIKGMGFGLAGALTMQPSPHGPKDGAGEFHWGGIAGTQWWISPRANLAALQMTQRRMAFLHPFALEFRKLVYAATGH